MYAQIVARAVSLDKTVSKFVNVLMADIVITSPANVNVHQALWVANVWIVVPAIYSA